MNFKAYDIISILVPGFLAVLVAINVLGFHYKQEYLIAYTTIAFFFGYLMNTISSWMEDFYFFTWGGKPSDQLLEGQDIWKVKFYHGSKAKSLLARETTNPTPSNGELFSIAMRKTNGKKDNRIEDFNASYAFARTLLTTILAASIGLIIKHYQDWQYYAVCIPLISVLWLRCKQKGYYFCREVFNEYLRDK